MICIILKKMPPYWVVSMVTTKYKELWDVVDCVVTSAFVLPPVCCMLTHTSPAPNLRTNLEHTELL